MNLAQAFAESARTNAAKPAIFWGERVFTYTETASLAAQVSAVLRSRFA